MGAYDCDCINNLEYEKRERKAQLSQEGTTSDLISRAETVERLRGVLDVTVPITDYDGGYVDGVEVGISTISTMPTIQPVATDANVGDTISRQAAIDEVNNAFDRETLLTGFVRSIAVRAIRDMPSAQPKPHEGYWIKHIDPFDGEQYECSECGVLWEFNDGTPEDNEAYFCPKCGTKMKGAEHETD